MSDGESRLAASPPAVALAEAPAVGVVSAGGDLSVRRRDVSGVAADANAAFCSPRSHRCNDPSRQPKEATASAPPAMVPMQPPRSSELAEVLVAAGKGAGEMVAAAAAAARTAGVGVGGAMREASRTASSIWLAVKPLDSRKARFVSSGRPRTLSSVRKRTAFLISSLRAPSETFTVPSSEEPSAVSFAPDFPTSGAGGEGGGEISGVAMNDCSQGFGRVVISQRANARTYHGALARARRATRERREAFARVKM